LKHLDPLCESSTDLLSETPNADISVNTFVSSTVSQAFGIENKSSDGNRVVFHASNCD
jgi:hypothetical protein